MATAIDFYWTLFKWGLGGLIFLFGASTFLYYWIVVRSRKIYECFIWEKRAGDTCHITGTDRLIRKSANYGKEKYYWFKKAKIETIPPLNEHVLRFNKKEYAFYRKIDDYSYLPMKPLIDEENLNFVPMDYDVNVLLVQALDRREKVYKLKKEFWEKYGLMISIALVIMLVIVVIYMTFDFIKDTIPQLVGVLNANANKLDMITERLVG